LGGGGGSFLPI